MRLSFSAIFFLLLATFFSGAARCQEIVPQSWGVINQKIIIKTGLKRLSKEQCTNNNLWKYIYLGPHARIIKYKIKPGAKYTLYAYYNTGVSQEWGKSAPSANVYCCLFNPLSKLKSKNGNSFVAWSAVPYKTKTGWTARRTNFTVDPKSSGDTIYLIVCSKKPGWQMGVKLKFPADADTELKNSDYNPIAKVRGFTWGNVFSQPQFCERLKGDPIAKTKPERIATTPPVVTPTPTKKASQSDIGQSMQNAGVVEYNSTVSAVMKPKDYDLFRFKFAGGQFLCYSQGPLDLVADLVDANGKTIARDDNSGSGDNFRFNRYLAAGTYGIQVRVMHHRGSGSYKIIFGNGRKKTAEKFLKTPPEKKDQKERQAYLGVAVKSISAAKANSVGLPSTSHGVAVTQVLKNSPASRAGLKAGDVILKLGGKKIKSAQDLQSIVRSRKPGENLNAYVVSPLNIKLGEKDDF